MEAWRCDRADFDEQYRKPWQISYYGHVFQNMESSNNKKNHSELAVSR